MFWLISLVLEGYKMNLDFVKVELKEEEDGVVETVGEDAEADDLDDDREDLDRDEEDPEDEDMGEETESMKV